MSILPVSMRPPPPDIALAAYAYLCTEHSVHGSLRQREQLILEATYEVLDKTFRRDLIYAHCIAPHEKPMQNTSLRGYR